MKEIFATERVFRPAMTFTHYFPQDWLILFYSYILILRRWNFLIVIISFKISETSRICFQLNVSKMLNFFTSFSSYAERNCRKPVIMLKPIFPSGVHPPTYAFPTKFHCSTVFFQIWANLQAKWGLCSSLPDQFEQYGRFSGKRRRGPARMQPNHR